MSELPKRKRNRIKDFDYAEPGGYFITICTRGNKCILSDIVCEDRSDNIKNNYTKIGSIVDKYLNMIESSYQNVSLGRYVIMPNHVHLILILSSGTPGSSSPTISQIISAFKRFVNKEIGYSIWQRSFYDHVIRETRDYEEISLYIENNPLKWRFDKFYSE